jgi:hypothetical protein
MIEIDELFKIRRLLKQKEQDKINNIIKKFNNKKNDINNMSSDLYIQNKIKSEYKQIEIELKYLFTNILQYIDFSLERNLLNKYLLENIKLLEKMMPKSHYQILINYIKTINLDNKKLLGENEKYFPEEYLSNYNNLAYANLKNLANKDIKNTLIINNEIIEEPDNEEENKENSKLVKGSEEKPIAVFYVINN